VSFFSLSLLQQEQQQSFSPSAVMALRISELIACGFSPFFFIGHDSAPSLQQSQSSQQEAASFPFASFFFNGHESPLQQQQETVRFAETGVVEYAKEAIERPSIIMAAIANIIFFFIYRTSIYLKIYCMRNRYI
jgi:hypothetical protein